MLPHWAPVAGPSHTYQARSSPPTACKAAACNQAWVSAGCCRSCAKAQRSVVSRPCASAADAPLDGSSPRPRAFTPAEPTQPAPQTAPASAGSSQEPNANAGSTSSSQQGAEAPAPVQSPPTPQHAAIAGALRESPAASLPPSLKAVRTQRMQLRLVALLFLIPLALGVLRLAIIFLDAVQSGRNGRALTICQPIVVCTQQPPLKYSSMASHFLGTNQWHTLYWPHAPRRWPGPNKLHTNPFLMLCIAAAAHTQAPCLVSWPLQTCWGSRALMQGRQEQVTQRAVQTG
jgi:hypothetical protein